MYHFPLRNGGNNFTLRRAMIKKSELFSHNWFNLVEAVVEESSVGTFYQTEPEPDAGHLCPTNNERNILCSLIFQAVKVLKINTNMSILPLSYFMVN